MYNKDSILSKPTFNLTDEFTKTLMDLQSNILKHHKKDYNQLIFLNVKNEKWKEARAFLHQVAIGGYQFEDKNITFKLTNAFSQIKEGLEKTTDEIVNIYLSYKGYQALNLEHLAPDSKAFKIGIETIDGGFNKENKYDNIYKDFHILISIASNSKGNITKIMEEIDKETSLEQKEEQFVELNLQQEGGKYYSVGHFGFIDGMSQPKFFPSTKKKTVNPNTISTLEAVLTEDKGGDDRNFCFGSFLAFLKLKQDVDAFNDLHTLIKNKAGISTEEAKAKIMGRYPNGAPIKDEDKKDEINLSNDFDYKDLFTVGENEKKWQNDDDGMKCPLFAHVRKANPRIKGANYRDNNKMVRRGMSYSNDDEKGLLFISFQRNLENQFEDLVVSMLHSPVSNNTPTGSDLLTGKAGIPRIMKVDNDEKVIIPQKPLITLKGGAYFFAPCISFFKNITKTLEPNVNDPVQVLAVDEHKNILLQPTHFGMDNIATEKMRIILEVDKLPSEKELLG